MYVAEIPNRNSPPTFLLRESYREEGKVKNRTLANITHLPMRQIQLLRRVLKGEELVSLEKAVQVRRSLPHGHVQAVRAMIERLGLAQLIAARRCRERDLVLAMIIQRLLHPSSKLAATRLWEDSTLAEEFEVGDADVDELYEALDWLLARQERIESRLAKRHLHEDGHVLYDVSSSSYTGHTCPLARFGHNRDGRHDLPCIVYGLLTDAQGRPVAVDVYPGNTGDPSTVPDQMDKLQNRFGLERIVAVGDRGMLTQTQIQTLRERPGLGWLSCLRSESIRKLVDAGHVERSLFDERHLAEIQSPDFPGERLIACYNPILADRRTRKRDELLKATETRFQRIAREVARRTKKPLGQDEIGVKVGRVLNKYKVGKHFTLTIEEGRFAWERCAESIDREASLDGIYVIRTSESADRLSAADAVRGYKRLADVEQAFRSLKGLDLLVRPIHHRVEERVKAHLLLCMLAYYVTWHLKQAWAPLLFADEQLGAHRATRDPVASATVAAEVKEKKVRRSTTDGQHPLHSFRTLLNHLGTQCQTTFAIGEGASAIEYKKLAEPTPLQAEAFRRLTEYCSQSLHS